MKFLRFEDDFDRVFSKIEAQSGLRPIGYMKKMRAESFLTFTFLAFAVSSALALLSFAFSFTFALAFALSIL